MSIQIAKRFVLAGLLAGIGPLLLAGCAARPGAFEEPEPERTEYLDAQTGATITTVEKPIVFARERTERAANLRDYVTLSAASVNRGGQRSYVLVAYVWSTLDARFSPINGARELVLRADDRRLVLSAGGKTQIELGIAQPVHPPKGKTLTPLVFPTDADTLRFLAASRSLEAAVGTDADAYTYQLWEDQRASLAKFLGFLDGKP